MDGAGDILDLDLAEIGHSQFQPVADLLRDVRADQNAARRRQRLETCRDVDAVAEEVVTLHDDIADIDSDAVIDSTVRRQIGVAFGHALLNRHCTGQGIHHARELN